MCKQHKISLFIFIVILFFIPSIVYANEFDVDRNEIYEEVVVAHNQINNLSDEKSETIDSNDNDNLNNKKSHCADDIKDSVENDIIEELSSINDENNINQVQKHDNEKIKNDEIIPNNKDYIYEPICRGDESKEDMQKALNKGTETIESEENKYSQKDDVGEQSQYISSINSTQEDSKEDIKIENCEYEIKSATNNDLIFDISSASYNDGAKLQLWSDIDEAQQRFYISDIGNGYYKFTSSKSNKVLDVQNAGTMSGTSVQQYANNESDAQQWIIKSMGDGLYSIMSKCNNLYMTLSSGVTRESKIVMSDWEDSLYQKFRLEKVIMTDAFRTIEDGYYEIKTAANQKLVMDVESASVENSANIQIWDDLDEEQQRFKVTYVGDGYYKISIQKSGKILDVRSAGMEEGTVVQQYSDNNSSAQRWQIKQLYDGKFKIISKLNSLCISIKNDNISRDTDLILTKNADKISQKFVFDKVVKSPNNMILEDGDYKIRSASNDELVFDIQCASVSDGANLQLWNELDEAQQIFNIKHLGDGLYQISVRKSNKALDIKNHSLKEGANVQQQSSCGSEYQRWIIQDRGNNVYSIISYTSGLYMTIQNSYINRDSKIVLSTESDDSSQKFIFDKIVKDKGYKTLEDGEYEIRTIENPDLILDISGASTQNCAKVQIWNDIDEAQQRFKLTYMGNGYYKISIKKSGKVVDVQNAGIKSGTSVQQYESNDTFAQRWIIKDLGNEQYSIISECNGLYMTIKGNNVVNGTSIVLQEGKMLTSQMFTFDKVVKDEAIRTIQNGEYEIRAAINERYIFDIQAASISNGAKLQLYTNLSQQQQRFIISYIGNGYYKITSKKSNKALDVQNACLKEGTSVQQYTSNNSDAQRWIIKDLGNGYYSFISECNGLYMASNGYEMESKIVLKKSDGSDFQKFRLDRVSERLGIDVSLYQGDINWSEVKQSGIEFAMIRVGYRGYGSGKLVQDSKFTYNMENALKNNIQCGAYFYSQAITEEEAIEEADFVIETIKKYNITYPIAFDSEYSTEARTGRADHLSVEERTKISKAFCERILSKGYSPMIYASKYWFYDNLNVLELQKYQTWLAHYVSNPKKGTDYKYDYNMWQYTSSGKVNGISGNVDMNIQKI